MVIKKVIIKPTKEKKKKAIDATSVGLWLLTATLFTSYTMLQIQSANPTAIVQAQDNLLTESFIIRECADGSLYGVGNKGIGGDVLEVGCFDATGFYLGGVTNCRELACY